MQIYDKELLQTCGHWVTRSGERSTCKTRVGAFWRNSEFFITDTWRALCCLLRQKIHPRFLNLYGGFLARLCILTHPSD